MNRTISNMKAARAMIAAAMLIVLPGVVFAADDVPLKGMIISHEDSTLVVRGAAGDTPVALTAATKIRGTSGVLGVRGEEHPASDLIRGLAVDVITTQDGDGVLTASEITFKNSDLKTARQMSAGIVDTENRVAENADRIDNVGELVAVGRMKVFFATGSAVVSAKGQQDLQAIATQAKAIKGYRLAVVGRADTTGNAAANQRLSEARAAAVSAYLMKSAEILPGRILPVAALGDSPIAQDPDPPGTNAEARRVTVTIAVSKSAIGQKRD